MREHCVRPAVVCTALLTVLFVIAAVPVAPADAQVHLVGQWRTLSSTMPINPIHVGLLRTGKVLVVTGSENDPSVTVYKAGVFNPQTGATAVQTIPWDLFCNGMSFLPDGRALITGGNLQYNPFRGIKTTTIFDPVSEKFIQVQDMARGRWYPSNALLADGKTMTFSGWLEGPGTNNAVELYDVASGWSPQFLAPFTPPLYPWLHLLPNGKVFQSGASATSRIFDPGSKTWTTSDQTNYGQTRTYGSSLLLPLMPGDGYRPRVMIMGGDNPATATAEIIDLGAATPRWRSVPSMSAPRIEMNAVLLPNGKVLALGGSQTDNVASTASLNADLFDPETETWSPAGRMAFARLYHSVALLLPDATVWVAGSNPNQGTWNNRMEVYSPAYLFDSDGSPAARPTLSSAAAKVGYGASFSVGTPDAADIASVVLVRPGASTHAFDMDQRLIGLNFTRTASALTVTAPPNANIAPPGYYMIFILNGRGVPSVAKFIQVSANPGNAEPSGSITAPTSDITIQAGQAVTFAGSGTDTDGSVTRYSWVFPGGTPMTRTGASPGAVVFNTPGRFTVSLTVTDNEGASDPTPATRTITVQGGGPPPPGPGLTVTMTSPKNGSTVSGTVWTNVWVAGNSAGTIAYTLSVAGTEVWSANSTATHVTLPWHTQNGPSGAQTLTATARDSAGKTGSHSVTVTVANGGPPPPITAAFTSPAAGATVSGTVSVGMSVSNASGSANRFRLSIDGVQVHDVTTSGTTASYSWNTASTSNAAHTLSFTVTDATGASASATRTVTVSNGGPPPPGPGLTVTMTSPKNGSTVSGTVWTNVWVAGNGAGTIAYTLSVAGTEVWSASSTATHVTLPWHTQNGPSGVQTLTATARDSAGKTGSHSVTVTVANGGGTPPPITAAFTSPAPGATVSGTVTVGMSVSNASGSANRFRLSIDGIQVHDATTAGTTASFSWNTAGASNASHTLSFTVTDATGASATATRTVTVANGGGTPPPGALTVTLTSPKNGSTVSGTVWVNVWVAGNSAGPIQYTLKDGATVVWSESSSATHVTLPWVTTNGGNGTHTLTGTAQDSAGKTGSYSVTVTVQN